MSDQNSGPLDITIDTTTTTTVTPMVADGVYAKWKLLNVKKRKNEKGDSLSFEFDLVDPAPNTEGGQIEPGKMGSRFFSNVTLYDKNTPAGQTPDWALKRIAQLQDALLGTGDPNNTKGKPSRPPFGPEAVAQMLGKILVAKMKVGKDQNNNPQSEFGTVVFPGDITA